MEHPALLARNVVSCPGTSVNLPRSRDFLFRIEQHLLPLRDPASRSRNREQHGKHFDRKPHRLINEARIEVHVRVQLARDEIVVLQGNAFELQRDFQERVLSSDGEDEIRDLLDDFCAGVVRLVDAVTESHQPVVAFARLHALDELRHFVHRSDLVQHSQDGFVRPAVERSVERRRRPSERRVRIGVRASDRPHRRRRTVLLVIGVEDEQHVERAGEHRVRLILQLGHLEQHVQEVAAETEIVVRIDVRAADAVAVGPRSDARHLGDQAVGLAHPRRLVVDVFGLRVKARHRADRAEEDRHRVRVVLEALHQLLDVLVQHGVKRDLARPRLHLGRRRQLPEKDQIRRFEIIAFFRELFNGISAVEQDAVVAVDVGDGAAAVRGVHERRVVCHQPEVVGSRLDLTQVHRADCAVVHRQLVFLACSVIDDGERVGHSRVSTLNFHSSRSSASATPSSGTA